MQYSKDIRRYYDFWFGLNDISNQLAKSKGITVNTWCILYLIDQHPDSCTMKFICEKMLLPKQTVHSALTVLAKKGYIVRVPHPEDKRNILLHFTEAGQKYADEVLSVFYRPESEAMEMIGEEVKNNFLESSYIFYQALREVFEQEMFPNQRKERN